MEAQSARDAFSSVQTALEAGASQASQAAESMEQELEGAKLQVASLTMDLDKEKQNTAQNIGIEALEAQFGQLKEQSEAHHSTIADLEQSKRALENQKEALETQLSDVDES